MGFTHAVPVTQQDTLKGPVHHMAEHHEGQEGLIWMWNLGFFRKKKPVFHQHMFRRNLDLGNTIFRISQQRMGVTRQFF